MKRPTAWMRTRRLAVPAVLAGLAIAAATACAGPSTDAASPDKAGGQLLVWGDATRQPAYEAYAKAHPNVRLKIEVIDPSALLSKIQLANRVGKGWPDVVFGSLDDVASLSSPLFDYAQPLDDLVPKDVQKQYATPSCNFEGKLRCLENDLAQDVIWYNKPLMKKFGYTVPKTWDEYKQLGDRVAKEHPGYIIGAVGDVNIWYDFLWGSGCPIANVTNSTQVQINTKDAKCTRVAETLDPLLKNGSVSRLSPFDPAVIKLAKADKILMAPGPSWFSEYVLKPDTSYAIPNGKIAAAPIPTWAGESTNYSGAWGGGVYIVSSHAANKQAATDVAQWITTAPEYQTTAPTYPAYVPAVQKWLTAIAHSPFYAEDPSQVLTDAAGKINPAVHPTRYQIAPVITSTVVASIKDGGTIADALPNLQTQLTGLAQTVGYEVTQ